MASQSSRPAAGTHQRLTMRMRAAPACRPLRECRLYCGGQHPRPPACSSPRMWQPRAAAAPACRTPTSPLPSTKTPKSVFQTSTDGHRLWHERAHARDTASPKLPPRGGARRCASQRRNAQALGASPGSRSGRNPRATALPEHGAENRAPEAPHKTCKSAVAAGWRPSFSSAAHRHC